jgi:hypothetical protein
MLTPEVNAAAVSALVCIINDRLLLPTLNAHVVLRAAQVESPPRGVEHVEMFGIRIAHRLQCPAPQRR